MLNATVVIATKITSARGFVEFCCYVNNKLGLGCVSYLGGNEAL